LDKETAAAALEAEKYGANRDSVIAYLEKLANG
jgi:hypothetical protein